MINLTINLMIYLSINLMIYLLINSMINLLINLMINLVPEFIGEKSDSSHTQTFRSSGTFEFPSRATLPGNSLCFIARTLGK